MNKGIPKGPFTKEHCDNISKGKKGSIPWNKCKTNVYSKEMLESMSLAKRGKPSPQKGKSHKPESIEKMKKAKIGYVPWSKGKKGCYPYSSWCKGLTKETSEGLRKLSEKMKGRQFTKEWLDKMSKAKKGKPQSKEHVKKRIAPLIGKKHSQERIDKAIENRKNWKISYRNTKPERMMQIALALNGIKFETQKLFKIGKSWHAVDIFISPNIILEVDGRPWHIKYHDMKRDLYQSQELTIMGYHVIRIRDDDILKNTQNCAEIVLRLINELKARINL